jgi:hypothetical protein
MEARDIPEAAPLTLLRERVEQYLKEGVGAVRHDADGDYSLFCDSARVFICPRVWTDDRTIVRIFSITNVDVAPTPELTEYLSTENFRLTFGHFAYNDAERNIWFIHNLLGDFLDPDELVTAVRMVAGQANQYDDLIREKFGGRLFTEGAAPPA